MAQQCLFTCTAVLISYQTPPHLTSPDLTCHNSTSGFIQGRCSKQADGNTGAVIGCLLQTRWQAQGKGAIGKLWVAIEAGCLSSAGLMTSRSTR